jgi:hypothetical protein
MQAWSAHYKTRAVCMMLVQYPSEHCLSAGKVAQQFQAADLAAANQ